MRLFFLLSLFTLSTLQGVTASSKPLEDCGTCQGNITSVTLRFNGSSSVALTVEDNNNTYVNNVTISPGESITITSNTSSGLFTGNKLDIHVNGTLHATIQTLCESVSVSSVFGDFTVTAGASKQGGALCGSADTGSDGTGEDTGSDDSTDDTTDGGSTGTDDTNGDNTGEDNSGEDTGSDDAGGEDTEENAGNESTDGNETDNENTGSEDTDGKDTEGENTGSENTGGEGTIGENTGTENIGNQTAIIVYNLEINQLISPNGDGTNDVWTLGNIDKFPDNEVMIADRWGNIIFTVTQYNNLENAWNGTNNEGGVMPAGTYFYRIRLRTATSNREEVGFVELVR